jgi:predicted permease
LASHLPLGDSQNNSRVFSTDLTYEPDDLGVLAWRSSVTPGYFAAAGTQIIRGRDFDRRDDADAPRAVIINQTLATTLWQDENPVGKRLRYTPSPGGTELEIVGVVESGPLAQVGEAPRAAMFSPLAQVPRTSASLVVHASSNPLDLVAAIRSEARAIDRAVPMSEVKTMEVHLTGSLWLFRMGAGLASALGFLALALASAGLYGVMSFAVGQRIRELGIRMALGADNRRVMLLVLQRGLILAGVGVAIGALASVGLAGMLSSMLVGVQPTDPVVLAAVGVGLGAVALLASIVPAWSAVKVDPVRALRTE